MKISNNSILKLKLQDMTAVSLSVATVQRVNRNTVGTLFSMMENLVTESTLPGRPGNIFSIKELGVKLSNSDIVITDRGLKNT
jgi:hypothetical protein